MANNVYGIKKQALFDPGADCDIFYYYKPSRSSVDVSFKGFKKIDNPATILSNSLLDNTMLTDKRLPGMYDLKLPVGIFGKPGIYTLYIVPKEIECTIKDVGALAAYPDIRGLVIDMNDMTDNVNLFKDDNLTGYRIEYLSMEQSNQGVKRDEYFTIITSCGRCEPVSQNLTSSNSNSNGYRYNVNGSLCFITVTPSTAPSYKSNSLPYLGVTNQRILIKNTKFDPICIEIEVTNHDIETLSYMIEGEQVRNLENGTVTTYTFDGQIYKQMEFASIKDNYTATNIAEIKVDRSNNIDRSLDLNLLKNS